jgi:hypothetical protein
MRLPPIQAEWLELPDDELGIRLLAWWIGAQAERKGIAPTSIPEHVAEQIIEGTKGIDTDQVQHVALEKALIKAASGELAKAGALFRGYMLIGADTKAATDMLSSLSEDTKRGIKVRRSARLGHESIHGTPVEKETKRRQQLDLIDKIRADNPGASDNKVYELAAATTLEVSGKKVPAKAFYRAENPKKK